MAIQLKKGQKINLTKGNPGLKHIRLGLGWDTNMFDGGSDFDLDVSLFMVGKSGKVEQDEDFIFYNNLKHPSEAVEHLGDNRTGDGDGDDEEILVDFSKMPDRIEKIAVTVTIYEAKERRQNFGQVNNSYVRLVNSDNEEELLRYDLGEEFSIETAIVVCEIYKHNGEWKFSAVGSGFEGGLEALCRSYGLNV
ncbi:TerD family protein [Intestinibacter bartlettii]|uniref:TerD family protein n=1 Tax=Intestinibacter bartlettii TaxID=261299 RepID=A0ABS6DSJ0_9FIRM|nr:TerD family protein [Intestinibacter bartlettii]MBU5334811.1 TerD family protein [Intestinibacter bartlettii]MDO5010894.1 TerD family protein [Intestinibacter bartlettii]